MKIGGRAAKSALVRELATEEGAGLASLNPEVYARWT
jgi:hypothetical protein